MAAAAGTGRHPAMDWQPMRASMQAAAGILHASPGEKHARRQPVIVRKSTEQVSTQDCCKRKHLHCLCISLSLVILVPFRPALFT